MHPLLLVLGLGGLVYGAYKMGSKKSDSPNSLPPYSPPPNMPTGATNVSTSDPLTAPMSILDVQKALNSIGSNPPLTEDGVKGTKTTDAIKSFQAKLGLTVDGIPGPQTWKALRQAVLAVHNA